ncbi:MAG TPA: hypothetical protein VJW23_09080, partial [Propionibacteriaceae bacterium]|nr:hypothetical protein [Propionibacteriaceae bacterium]
MTAAEREPVFLVAGELVFAAISVVYKGCRRAAIGIGLMVEERDADVIGVELDAAKSPRRSSGAVPAVNSTVSYGLSTSVFQR